MMAGRLIGEDPASPSTLRASSGSNPEQRPELVEALVEGFDSRSDHAE